MTPTEKAEILKSLAMILKSKDLRIKDQTRAKIFEILKTI